MAAMAISANVMAQEDADKNYIRNSVYMIKLDEAAPKADYAEAFKIMNATFDTINFARNYERYNDFALDVRHIDFSKLPAVTQAETDAFGKETAIEKAANEALKSQGLKTSASEYEYAAKLSKYFTQNQFAHKLVAKWYSKPGTPVGKCNFDDNLQVIYELGLKGLSQEAYDNAKATGNLTSMAYGSTQKLLSNTYVCVNRYSYMSAEEVVAVTGAAMKLAAANLPALAQVAANKGIDLLASKIKGYFVRANAFLFRLDWNEAQQKKFERTYWSNPAGFMKDNSFKLTYMGKSAKRAPAGLSLKASTTLDKLIARATVRGTDAAFAALQRDYEDFRPMTSLHVIDGKLAAYIGMKEGVTSGDKFNVYEAVQSKTDPNLTEWKEVGTIKVEKGCVWDNRAGAGEVIEGASSDTSEKEDKAGKLPYTVFSGKPGKLGEGNMIRLAK